MRNEKSNDVKVPKVYYGAKFLLEERRGGRSWKVWGVPQAGGVSIGTVLGDNGIKGGIGKMGSGKREEVLREVKVHPKPASEREIKIEVEKKESPLREVKVFGRKGEGLTEREEELVKYLEVVEGEREAAVDGEGEVKKEDSEARAEETVTAEVEGTRAVLPELPFLDGTAAGERKKHRRGKRRREARAAE